MASPEDEILKSMPTIAQWAQYGTYPGVLIGIIVIMGGFYLWLNNIGFKYVIEWHEKQMQAQREFHAVERKEFIERIAQLTDEIIELRRIVERMQK